jgi:hypothetical protein|tara:strand:- start:441 stop:644 length:204 start_codon:yes stop_codon:yes gene_type:complete
MITKLTNTELNVLAVALDHMEDHLGDLLINFDVAATVEQTVHIDDVNHNVVTNLRLEALDTLKKKLL